MTDVSSKNLQIRLFILVVLAFIPALGFFWHANRELRSLQLQSKEQELVQRAEVTAAEYSRIVQEGQIFLAALAEFPEIRDAQGPTCTRRLQSIIEHTPHYTTITFIGMDGYMRCGALTAGGELFLGDRAYFVRATNLNRFSVGEYSLGRITGRPVVGLALPISSDGEMRGVLASSLDLENLAETTRGTALPEDHTFTVLDRNQRVLVRRPTTGDFTLADSVGAVAGEGFPGLPDGRTASIVSGIDLDGVERLFAVAGLRGAAGQAQGYVAIGRTRATLMDEVDKVVGTQLRFLATMAILLLALAWVLGHFWLVRGSAAASDA